MFVGRTTTPPTETLRIGIDARCLNVRHLRGMGNYLRGMIGGLAGLPELHWDFLSNRPDLPFHNPLPGTTPALHNFDCPGHRFQLWEQAALPMGAVARHLDVLHCPQNSAPWWQPVPTVITIHDTMIWDRDESMDAGFYRDTLLPQAFHRAAGIITISEQSKRDILRRWPKLGSKLHVIPHGVEAEFLDAQPAPLSDDLRAAGIEAPYLLYCGGLMPRKRMSWAVEILATLDTPNLMLVVCGVPAEGHAAAAASLPPEIRARVRFAPFIEQRAMPRLFQNAAAVLYPTLYEGFGFPALEAQAVGTPVLMSPLGSLAELNGPGAVMLDPEDRTAWIEATRRIVAERTNLVPDDRARRWARGFSWDVSAAAHLAVYRHAAGRTD